MITEASERVNANLNAVASWNRWAWDEPDRFVTYESEEPTRINGHELKTIGLFIVRKTTEN